MHRILLITTSYPAAQLDGREAAGSFVADFAQALVALGVKTTVLAPGDSASIAETAGVTVCRFAGPSRALSLLNPINPAHWPSIWNVLRRGARMSRQLAQNHRFDHVLALWALPSGYWARRLKREFGIPYSVWALGSDIWSLGRLPAVRAVLRGVLRDADNRYADGYVLKADVEALCGRPCDFLPSTRRLHVPSGAWHRGAPPYRMAFLGRWHPNKGADLLLEALERLDQQDWTAIEEFRICGGGPLDALVRTRGAALAAAGRPVTVGGYLDKQAAAELLVWADYLVIPSRIESIPVIFSDAMQCACPVIATPVGDLPRLLRNCGAGMLSTDVSADAIARAIREAAATTPSTFAEGLARCRREFDIDECAARLLRQLGGTPEIASGR
jgi:glycosyltransferase involved in cell wall biosynthesis